MYVWVFKAFPMFQCCNEDYKDAYVCLLMITIAVCHTSCKDVRIMCGCKLWISNVNYFYAQTTSNLIEFFNYQQTLATNKN